MKSLPQRGRLSIERFMVVFPVWVLVLMLPVVIRLARQRPVYRCMGSLAMASNAHLDRSEIRGLMLDLGSAVEGRLGQPLAVQLSTFPSAQVARAIVANSFSVQVARASVCLSVESYHPVIGCEVVNAVLDDVATESTSLSDVQTAVVQVVRATLPTQPARPQIMSTIFRSSIVVLPVAFLLALLGSRREDR